MSDRDESKLKTPEDKSPKPHMEQPPKKIEPKGDVQEHHRGEVGQFTDKGAPGQQRY